METTALTFLSSRHDSLLTSSPTTWRSSELIGVFGYVLYFSGLARLLLLLSVAAFFRSFTWFAQILLPIVTCVDRYVAAVHPITYLGLRQAGGVRIRNVTAGGVWLISAAGGGLLFIRRFYDDNNILPLVTPLIVSLVVTMFCSLSVLRVLIRPRPGKVGGDRVQVDQSKQRAVHTMTVIMGTLWLRFGGNVVSIMMKSLAAESVGCAGEALNFLFSLPSSVVLFLLFIHRAGKLKTCTVSTVSTVLCFYCL
ncbi:hypothetical protein L3Q82_003736 [Scortum barcoo]|uniref:Uncharacterized protein n=1 Tax=Scortum barcoo TaxID=214431 RepID=A0ACB8X719_9TELE|nr:hypothetical protein L3Q82_003736 [Scortum barcoo]